MPPNCPTEPREPSQPQMLSLGFYVANLRCWTLWCWTRRKGVSKRVELNFRCYRFLTRRLERIRVMRVWRELKRPPWS